jgi:CBS domain-containing protein
VTDDRTPDTRSGLAAAGGPTDDTLGPTAFLRSLPPFDRLDDVTFAPAAAALEVTYVVAGERVVRRGGDPSPYLHIVRKGTALRSRDDIAVHSVEPGEWFDLRSVLEGSPPEFDVEAVDDLLLYRLPADVVRTLAGTPAFAAEARGLASRLRAASVDADFPATLIPMAPVSSLIARDLVVLPPEADVGTIARRMREEGVSSVVLHAEPPAIVTTRDLRDRVLADGHGPDTPGLVISSRPILAVDGATPVVEARVTMLERAIHHLGIEHEGELVGVVTTGDLLREDASSPFHVQRELASLPRGSGAQVPQRLHATVARLLGGGLSPLEVTRTVSMLTDVLVRRAVALAIEDLGSPPTAFAWLTLGSDARREQTLLTDQDHALVHEEVDEDGAAWFSAFATDVAAQLAAAGLPYCPGGVMATNWSGSLETWRGRFRRWLAEPDVTALLEASIFFDHRVVAGTVTTGVLDDEVRAHRRDGVLLARLAAAAGRFRPPLGLLHRVRSTSEGAVDLKAGGVSPIVALARVLAVEAGSTATATVERIEAAVAHGGLSSDAAEELIESFRFFQTLRMQQHLRAWRQGTPASNDVPFEAMNPTRRRHLKEAFVAVARIQRATIQRLGGEEVAG